MWPWGHLAVGYLAYVAWGSRDPKWTPGDRPTLVLAFATQLPDIVDKSLAWYLGVLPNGRSLAHSLLIATIVIGIGYRIAAAYGRRDLAAAGAIGYLSHLGADALGPLLGLRFEDLAFLVWPVLPAPPYVETPSVGGYFATLFRDLAAGHVSAFFAFELALTVIALALWVSHGCPGLPFPGRGGDRSGREEE